MHRLEHEPAGYFFPFEAVVRPGGLVERQHVRDPGAEGAMSLDDGRLTRARPKTPKTVDKNSPA